MPLGPGKYSDMAEFVRDSTNAMGAVVIVFEGNKGSGFAVQIDERSAVKLHRMLPDVLENIAGQMRQALAEREWG